MCRQFLSNSLSFYTTCRLPKKQDHCWFHYPNKESVDALLAALNQEGQREGLLICKLKKAYKEITEERPARPVEEKNGEGKESSLLESFREVQHLCYNLPLLSVMT